MVILVTLGITFGIMALSCRNFTALEAQTLIYALGTVFCIIIAVFFSVKVRGFGVFTVQPTIIFTILAIIAFYSESGID